MYFAVVYFQNFDFPLPEERDCFLPMDDPQGFVGRVEQEGHFHAGTSSPIGLHGIGQCFRGVGLLQATDSMP